MTPRTTAYSLEGEHVVGNPPERLEQRVAQCSAIDETGERCRTLTLHARCHRHRARTSWRREDAE